LYCRKIHDDLLCNGCRNTLSNDIVRMPYRVHSFNRELTLDTASTPDMPVEQDLNSGKELPSFQKHLDGLEERLEQ
jgi:hypothetical protein